MNVTRMYTVQLGNVVLVVSNVSATMNHIPPGLPEFPMFPGIPEYKLRNKMFNTLSMDLHIMDNAQIKRSWYFTDHSLALDQMLTEGKIPNWSMSTFLEEWSWKKFLNLSITGMISSLVTWKNMDKMMNCSKRPLLKTLPASHEKDIMITLSMV